MYIVDMVGRRQAPDEAPDEAGRNARPTLEHAQ